MKILFKDELVRVKFDRYSNNDNVAISLMSMYGEPVAMCTINIEELPDNLVAIKNYSESEGMDKHLIEAGVIKDMYWMFNVGYASVPVYELTDKSLEALRKHDKNNRR